MYKLNNINHRNKDVTNDLLNKVWRSHIKLYNKILQFALHGKIVKHTCELKRCRSKGLGVWSMKFYMLFLEKKKNKCD